MKMKDPAELSKLGFNRGIFGGDIEAREIDPENKTIVHYASTKAVDSYNTVILPDAFDFTRFAKNPVVPWVHDYRSLPVARSLWQKTDNNGLLVKSEFFPGDFPMEVFKYYELGFLKGWSVGFDWLEFLGAHSKEHAEKYGAAKEKWDIQGYPDYIFTKVDLWEYSAVPVPSNPEALTKALRDGEIRTLPFRRALESIGLSAERKAFPGAALDAEEPEEGAPEPEEETPEADQEEPEAEEEGRAASLDDARLTKLEAMVDQIIIKLTADKEIQVESENTGLEISADQLRTTVSDVVRGEIQKLRGKVS
jgi:hypothetical protein